MFSRTLHMDWWERRNGGWGTDVRDVDNYGGGSWRSQHCTPARPDRHEGIWKYSRVRSSDYGGPSESVNSESNKCRFGCRGGQLEEWLGRPQLLLFGIAMFVGIFVGMVLLWIRAANLCRPDQESEPWSPGRRRWCCSLFQVGCIGNMTESGDKELPFNCDEEGDHWERGWSDLKRAYCCKAAGKGCVVPRRSPSADSPHYNCTAGWSDWYFTWTVSKQAWCCQNTGRGCVVPKASSRDDLQYCNDTRIPLQSWSPVKKEWCCWYRGMGCTQSSATLRSQFDCSLRAGKTASDWSPIQRAWCCDNLHIGCESTPIWPPSRKPEDDFIFAGGD